MDGGEKKIIIVKKKKGGHGGHHGGSWKVAYADFVTAMMAFFLVMWIMSMDEGVKDLVQGYFSNPIGWRKAFSGGQNPLSSGNAPTNLDIRRAVLLSREYQRAAFEDVAEEIEEGLEASGVTAGIDAAVEIEVTDQGLRIELMETGEGDPFFDRSSAELKPTLARVLGAIAPRLNELTNPIVIEGHTDAMPFANPRPGYTNWELSADRAQAARRVLEASGLGRWRVAEVRGYADRKLKVPDDPYAARNRRISLLLPFEDVTEAEALALLGREAHEVATDTAAAVSEDHVQALREARPGGGH
ncbi:MAG: hypothetical protein D6701_07565 [Gemmatimonadetes bacterium]|nr:MAG: hypothetical protein D6701_07565 [Gemmatimonadota bacterium]